VIRGLNAHSSDLLTLANAYVDKNEATQGELLHSPAILENCLTFIQPRMPILGCYATAAKELGRTAACGRSESVARKQTEGLLHIA